MTIPRTSLLSRNLVTAAGRMHKVIPWVKGILFVAVLAMAAYLYYLARFVPVYVDELQWKTIGSRIFLDDFRLIYLFPQCSAGFDLPVPISWYPARIVDALIYQDMTDVRKLRWLGMLNFALMFAIAGWLLARQIRDGPPATMHAAGLALAFSSFGVLPFLFVLNRPEQSVILPLLLSFVLFVLFRNRSESKDPLISWALALAFVLIGWFMIAAHLKGLFLLPPLLAVAFLTLRRALPFAVGAVALGVAAAETYSVWSVRTFCPESPHLMRVFSSLSLSPAALDQGLGKFLLRVSSAIQHITVYVRNAEIAPTYQANWLPSGPPLDALEILANVLLRGAVIAGLAIIVANLLAAFTFKALRRDYPWSDTFLSVLLMGSNFALAGFQTTKNFYESPLQWTIFGMAAIFAVRGLSKVAYIRLAAPLFVTVALAAALTSQIALARRFSSLPQMTSGAEALHPPAHADIRKVADLCNLRTDRSERRLIVDETAYTQFWATREPVFLPLVHGWWATGIDLDQVIKTQGLTAMVGSCRSMPERFRRNRVGEYCCSRLP